MMTSLLEKYSPKKVADIVGQNSALMQIIEFLDNFKAQKRKSMIIHGPTGVGKSCAVYTIAKELDYDIVELNASDLRNKEVIETMISTASKTGSLFGKRKMIFIDEAESFASKDRGGITALLKIVKETKIPVVFIVFDIWNQKIRSLKSCSVDVEFKKVHYASINKLLRQILDSEKISYDPAVTEFISKSAGGDVRSAINDLDTISAGKKSLGTEDLVFLEDRPKEEKIFSAVQKIFKTTDLNESRSMFDSTGLDIDLFSLWVSDNIINEYEKQHEIAAAYNCASRSDVFSGRIRRRQSWELYKYVIDLITAGVSAAKDSPYRKFTRYSPPSKLMKLYQTKSKRALKKKVCEKLSSELHASAKKVEQHYLPFMKTLFKNKEIKKNISENLALEKEEILFLGKGV